jgi:hypothetical protein
MVTWTLVFQRALKMTEKALSKLKNHRVSYLNGDAGPLAIGAMLYHAQGAEAKSQDCIDRYSACC